MALPIWFRWLGVAGIELRANDQILVIDPFFTRPPIWRMWFGRVHPNRSLIAKKIQRCHFVLVTHAHWDHVMDVPEVVRHTGATAFGSPNACQLLVALGVPEEQIHKIEGGDKLLLGEFEVEVLPAEHRKTPIDRFINGPLPANLLPPLRLRDYRMDHCFSFLVHISEYRLLCGEQPVPADVLFAVPLNTLPYYESLLRHVQPQAIIPIHWDDPFRPLSKPVRPMFKLPAWAIPPLQRMDPSEFKQEIEEIAPETTVLIPEMFRTYTLSHLM